MRSRRGARLALLVVTLALVATAVAAAHWRVDQMTAGAPDWSTTVSRSEPTIIEPVLAVAGPNAFVDDGGAALTVVRVSDGSVVHEAGAGGITPGRLTLGQDGSFVVEDYSEATFAMAAYDADGTELWVREEQLGSVTSIGEQGVTLSGCLDGRCVTRLIDPSGEEAWQLELRSEEDPNRGSGPQMFQHRDYFDLNDLDRVTTVPSVPTTVDEGRLFPVDLDGEVVGDGITFEGSAMVGDVMVESRIDGDACRFRALQDGQEVWSSQADCAGRTFGELPWARVLTDRVYWPLSPEGGDTDAVVGVDLDDGTASVVEERPRRRDRDDDTTVWPGQQVILAQEGAEITGLSPTTGDEVWEHSIRGRTGTGAAARPAWIRAVDGAVVVEHPNRAWWRLLAAGADWPGVRVTVLDPATGDERAVLATPSVQAASALPDGSALVISDGVLHRIGAD